MTAKRKSFEFIALDAVLLKRVTVISYSIV